MVRARIDLAERQRDEPAAVAGQLGKRQGEVIREEDDRFTVHRSHLDRGRILRDTAGLWRDRSDAPDFRSIRASWKRDRAVSKPFLIADDDRSIARAVASKPLPVE